MKPDLAPTNLAPTRGRSSIARGRGRAGGAHAGLLFAASLAMVGCFGSKTPLAPSLGGSVGMPHYGVLTEAVALPKSGRGYVLLRPSDPARFGLPRLVAGIERAAREVDEKLPGGARLVVGDLSRQHGGKAPRHNSHRTGRDVDLLWYVTTPSGASVKNPGFIRMGSDALARVHEDERFLMLDIPRQWLLIRTMLLDRELSVQFLFASREVEALLIDYGLARGEPLDLLYRAETVLLQPGDSAAHDDHVHLRIACSPKEAIRGCEGGGPYWEWLPPRPELGPVTKLMLAEIAKTDPIEPSAGPPERSAGAVIGQSP